MSLNLIVKFWHFHRDYDAYIIVKKFLRCSRFEAYCDSAASCANRLAIVCEQIDAYSLAQPINKFSGRAIIYSKRSHKFLRGPRDIVANRPAWWMLNFPERHSFVCRRMNYYRELACGLISARENSVISALFSYRYDRRIMSYGWNERESKAVYLLLSDNVDYRVNRLFKREEYSERTCDKSALHENTCFETISSITDFKKI